MKKFYTVLLVISLIGILVACGSAEEITSTEPKEEAKLSEQKEVSNKPKEVEEVKEEEPAEETEETTANVPEVKKDENGNYVLDTVGQVVEAPEFATVELMKIKPINEIVDISPIKVTIKDIKLFKLTNIDEYAKTDLAMYNNNQQVADEVHYIQIAYSSENTEEKNVEWYGIEKVVLSNGQQLDAMLNDFIINDEDMDSIFYGKVKKDGTVGLIYKGKPEDITSVKLILYYSLDADSYEEIAPSQQVQYEL